MDLFSSITEDIKPRVGIDELARRVTEFVSTMDRSQVNAITVLQKEREFEAWETAARKTQAFAFEKGLKADWWAVMAQVREAMSDVEYTVGWDAAFDYIAASFVKPWAGTAFPNKYYDLMTKPLIRAGFTE